MSTEYELAEGFEAVESSCDLFFCVEHNGKRASTRRYSNTELKDIITKLIKAAAWCQEDPQAFGELFNIEVR